MRMLLVLDSSVNRTALLEAQQTNVGGRPGGASPPRAAPACLAPPRRHGPHACGLPPGRAAAAAAHGRAPSPPARRALLCAPVPQVITAALVNHHSDLSAITYPIYARDSHAGFHHLLLDYLLKVANVRD